MDKPYWVINAANDKVMSRWATLDDARKDAIALRDQWKQAYSVVHLELCDLGED